MKNDFADGRDGRNCAGGVRSWISRLLVSSGGFCKWYGLKPSMSSSVYATTQDLLYRATTSRKSESVHV